MCKNIEDNDGDPCCDPDEDFVFAGVKLGDLAPEQVDRADADDTLYAAAHRLFERLLAVPRVEAKDR